MHVPQQRHPVELAHLGRVLRLVDARCGADAERLGVGPLQVEGQPRLRVGQVEAGVREAEGDRLEVARVAAVERPQERSVGGGVDLPQLLWGRAFE